MGTKGDGGGYRGKLEVQNIHLLLYIEQVNSKVLLDSTENYIQYPIVTFNGKEFEKEYVYIYVCMYVCKN